MSDPRDDYQLGIRKGITLTLDVVTSQARALATAAEAADKAGDLGRREELRCSARALTEFARHALVWLEADLKELRANL